jgi:glycosyltransferase involved in cell wall biosynthesis
MHDALDFYPALRPSRIWSLYMRLVGVPAARRAQAVLTGSDAGAREIAELIGIDRARLVVVPYGSTLSETDVCPSQAPHRPTPGDYVLAFGDFSRRKNLQTAITAVELVRDLGHEVDMVVVGSMPADAAKGKPWLHAKAAVGDRELAELYRGARAVLIPSRHEGFGLPAAEALGLGTPVVASDIPALREIGGTWARFASPDDPDGFARELRAILDDPGRDVMASHQRPLQVSWEVTARRTAAVYEQIVQMYPRRRAWVSTVLS